VNFFNIKLIFFLNLNKHVPLGLLFIIIELEKRCKLRKDNHHLNDDGDGDDDYDGYEIDLWL